MKVLMLTWEFPPFIAGGLGMACYGMVKSLLKMGVEVYLLIPTEKFVYFHLKDTDDVNNLTPIFMYNEEEDIYKGREFNSIEERLEYLGLYRFPESYYQSGEHYYDEVLKSFYTKLDFENEQEEFIIKKVINSMDDSRSIFNKIKLFTKRLSVLIDKIDFDIIHAHDWLTYPAGIYAKFHTGKKLVTHIHATEFDRAGGPGDGRVHNIEFSGMSYADLVIAVSNYTTEMIVSRYMIDPSKVRVVHNAFYLREEVKDYNSPFKDPIILFLGRITLQKGPDYFLEVAKRVLDQVHDVRFVMAGSGDMTRRLIMKAASYRLKTRFLFTGFLKRKDVARILKASDIYILSSVSEPFGIAPLEAMSFKNVALISKQSGVSEVVKNAYKIDFWDIDKMVNIIVDLLKNREKIEEIKDKGQEEVRNIQWDNSATKIKKVYEELVC